MIKLAADENFDNKILSGLRRRSPNLDLIRVQDAGLSAAPDTRILEWAASVGRVLLTQDVSTVRPYAYQRILAGLPMAGVIEVRQQLPVAQAIEEILIVAECSLEGEWEGQVRYLPL